MWLRNIICLLCFFCFSIEGKTEDLPPKNTIGLIYTTNTNYVLTSWDTVYVVIVDSVGELVDTAWLSSDGNGIWSGSYLLDGLPPGSYTKIIHYDYEGDICGERESFAIIDTSELQGEVVGLTEDLVYFWGACDSCYARYFPEDGTANKDSAYLINPKLTESDTLTAKVVFRHSNVSSVADSSYFYLNPWW